MQDIYDFLKIMHVIFASILCLTIAYDIHCWVKKMPHWLQQLQKHSFTIIIPLSIIQLLLGFTMISLKHYDFHEKWIVVSIIGFPIFVISWILFIYLSIYVPSMRAQRLKWGAAIQKNAWMSKSNKKYANRNDATYPSILRNFLRHAPLIMLGFAIFSLLFMIFFMTNKII